MTRLLSATVRPEDAGLRLDAFLAARGCYATRSAAAKRIERGAVSLNGATPLKSTLVGAGDTVVYEQATEEEHAPLAAIPIPLDVRFEDEHLLVLSKQAGLCVHPAPNVSAPTLVNALLYRYGRDDLAHIQGDDRPGIVHRLDADTSGLMLCAKDDAAGQELQEAIRIHAIDRRYLTLVHGRIAPNTGLIDEPIARSDHNRLKMRVADVPSARPSQTTFTVLARFDAGRRDDGYTLLECRLHTGRTHQIRVHMHFIHHCCVGDVLYGAGNANVQLGLRRQFLHSWRIGFTHPATGEGIQLFDALPPDLQDALDSLRERDFGTTEAGERVFALLDDAPCQPDEVAHSCGF